MNYELTVTVRLESDHTEGRISKQFESLFEFGTIKESITEGLQLLNDPQLVSVAVTERSISSQPYPATDTLW